VKILNFSGSGAEFLLGGLMDVNTYGYIFAFQILTAMYLDVNEIVNLALESPKTVMIYNHLKSYLEEEKLKRAQFYNDISENQKAEFINGEMIQVILEANAEKLSIEEWYKKQFDVSSIKTGQRVIKKGWTGVWSEDRMVAYLAHPLNNKVYSLSYSVGENYILSYNNIFELMINSLELK
jgi:RecG-like helicase